MTSSAFNEKQAMNELFGYHKTTFDSKEIEEKYSVWFEICRHISQFAEKTMQVLPPDLTRTYHQLIIMLAFHCRTMQKSVGMLCRMGFGIPSAILTRALFEGVVNCAYIAQDKSGCKANKFFEFNGNLKCELEQKLKCGHAPATKDWEGKGCNLRLRAESIYLGKDYQWQYWSDSQFVHANIGIISAIIQSGNQGEWRFRCGPQDSDLIPKCLWHSTRMLAVVLSIEHKILREVGLSLEGLDLLLHNLRQLEQAWEFDFAAFGKRHRLSDLVDDLREIMK